MNSDMLGGFFLGSMWIMFMVFVTEKNYVVGIAGEILIPVLLFYAIFKEDIRNIKKGRKRK